MSYFELEQNNKSYKLRPKHYFKQIQHNKLLLKKKL